MPTAEPKRVLVVGGGIGDMEAARVEAIRGHDVTPWERSGELGGEGMCLANYDMLKDLLAFHKVRVYESTAAVTRRSTQ